MKVLWTKNAKIQLQNVEEFIANDNPSGAIDFTDELIDLAETLAEYPEKGRVVPELSHSNIRELLNKNYRIVYLIKKDRVEILTLFEGHRLLKSEDIL